jgi:flagellar biosynthesis component FlhA
MDLPTHAKKLKVALLVAGLMLCLAVFPGMPYVFYVLLKWTVCSAAVYGALNFKDDPRLNRHFWPLGVLALLFNPFVPAPLTPLVWLILDLGTAVYFLTLTKKF